MKLEKLGSLPLKLLCCLCVPHLLQEQEHDEYICENLKQEIRVFQHTFLKKPNLKVRFQTQSHLLFTQETSFHSYLL